MPKPTFPAVAAAVLAALIICQSPAAAAGDAEARTCADPEASARTALQACQRVIDSGGLSAGEEARALVNLALAHVELGNLTPALGAYDRAAGRDPQLARIFSGRAVVRDRLGQADAALADFNRALTLAPNDAGARMGRGIFLLRAGQAERAMADFGAILARDPDNLDALFNRALAAARLNRTEEAVRGFSAVLAQRPDDPAAWLERGQARADSAPDAALQDLDQAIRTAPEWPAGYVARGRLFDRLGRKAEADRDFLRAFELGLQADWLTERVSRLRSTP